MRFECNAEQRVRVGCVRAKTKQHRQVVQGAQARRADHDPRPAAQPALPQRPVDGRRGEMRIEPASRRFKVIQYDTLHAIAGCLNRCRLKPLYRAARIFAI